MTALNKNAIELDARNGLPQDYYSLFAAYESVPRSAAVRLKIPAQDISDCVQEVQLKFWKKNGLDLFDPDKNTKFSTFYRGWTQKFLLQERDRVYKSFTKHMDVAPEDFQETEWDSAEEFEDSLLTDDFITQWVDKARNTLADSAKPHLVKLFDLCLESAEIGKKPSKASVAETLGIRLTQVATAFNQMRRILERSGLGMESLYEAAS